MVGLVFLAIIGVYLLTVLGVTLAAIYIARRYQARPLIRGLAGLGGFLLVTLPIFWDWAPVVAAHNHYCAKDAGFFLYKSPEQWMKENPGVAETLASKVAEPDEEIENGKKIFINKQFAWTMKNATLTWGIHQREQAVVDRATGEPIALWRDYDTGVYGSLVGGGGGGLRDWKLWMRYRTCEPGDSDPSTWIEKKKFNAIRSAIYSLGDRK